MQIEFSLPLSAVAKLYEDNEWLLAITKNPIPTEAELRELIEQMVDAISDDTDGEWFTTARLLFLRDDDYGTGNVEIFLNIGNASPDPLEVPTLV